MKDFFFPLRSLEYRVAHVWLRRVFKTGSDFRKMNLGLRGFLRIEFRARILLKV